MTGASAPHPAKAGGAPSLEDSRKKKSDPLEGRPELSAIHNRLRERIIKAHPKAKLPAEGSTGWHEERHTVARLVELDGYSPKDLCGCFQWLFNSDDDDALFWRGNVRAITHLCGA